MNRPTLRAVLLASCGLLSLTDTASSQGTITLYDNSSYGGANITLPLLAHLDGVLQPIPGGLEDRVTSLRWNLSTNVIVKFFENRDGTGREFSVRHDQARVGGDSNVGSYYNDKFSSFRFTVVDPSQGWVRFHTNANFGGYEFMRYVSQTGFTIQSLRDRGYNDQVDSIRWSLPRGTTIMCFDEDPAGGRALPLLGTGAVSDLNNSFSGLHHDKFSTFAVMRGELTATFADRNAPIDRVCQLSSHNAHVSTAHGWSVWYNQTMPLLEQLDYGARVLQLDVREENNALYLTHGSWSASIAQRAGLTPELLAPALDALHTWLSVHSREVIFLVFENYTGAELTNALRASRLGGMLYRPNGLHWPSINQLADAGRRVVVLDSSSSTGELYEWDWEVQNDYSSFGSTAARSESDPIDGLHRSLFLMNHISGSSTPTIWFGISPNTRGALVDLARQFPQPPNFVNIDGISMADHGGLEACREINDRMWRVPQPRATSYAFHAGCGSTLESTTRPALGRTWTLNATDADWLLFGLSDTSNNGAPLPMSLQPLSTCLLRAAPMDAIPVGANHTFSLPIPNDSRLVGGTLYGQALEFVPGNIYLSNGVAGRIGY